MTSQALARPRRTEIDRETLGLDTRALRRIPASGLLVRFVFGAAVSAISGIIGEALGERAAGVLLGFPAILPAALTLIEQREGTSTAVSDVRGAAAGAIGLLGFAISAMLLAERIPVILALLIAAVAWLAIAAALYFGGRALAGSLGVQQYLPEVSVTEAMPLAAALRASHRTIAAAESCTGGALTALLTAVPKASEVFPGGIVAYRESVKNECLGVSQEVLDRYGTVSEEAALSMADAARQRVGADLGIAITGALGAPVDGVEPGRMYVCVAGDAGALVTTIEGEGTPEAQRAEAIRRALRLAQKWLDEHPSD